MRAAATRPGSRHRSAYCSPVRVRLVRSVGLALAGLLLLGSCGDDGASGDGAAEVRPFDLVQASDFVFESDPLDLTRGIFRVTTTSPMICAIVWGTDESFGRFNNSLSMNGTGIEQHDVSLPDVEPGVTYTYVVQGTTADGTLYRSEVGTFVIGEASTSPPASVEAPGKNVATTASVIDVSSEFSGAFAATNAIDDDLATEWATSGDGDGGSITLDLGADVQIVAVDFLTRSMADGSAITSTFTVSIDDTEPVGPFPAGSPAQPRPATIDGRGRSVRFDVASSSGGNVGAVEIRVYV
jgi:hypothetical protein